MTMLEERIKRAGRVKQVQNSKGLSPPDPRLMQRRGNRASAREPSPPEPEPEDEEMPPQQPEPTFKR